MNTSEISPVLGRLFTELVGGTSGPPGPFILNSGDLGLLRSLDKLSASDVLESPRDVSNEELAGMIASITHLAYHFGAIRQISKDVRGPKEGTF